MKNELVTLALSFHEEQVKGKGEDSSLRILGYPNGAVIASMDGCGGSGAKVYSKANYITGARIASMHVGIALKNWFETNRYGYLGTGGKSAEELAEEMKFAIWEELEKQHTLVADEESAVHSALVKTFPTTVAGALLEALEQNLIRCLFFWAGDSRNYLLQTTGLRQISIDDIRGRGDPFDDLTQDARLSNCISFGQNYQIRTREILINEPCMVITATDGCFSYYQSPLELEWILLDKLAQADTPWQWEELLRTAIGGFAGDDYTMNIAVVGFRNWQAVKTAYLPRRNSYEQTYYAPLQKILDAGDRNAHLALWQKYKAEYMPESRSV